MIILLDKKIKICLFFIKKDLRLKPYSLRLSSSQGETQCLIRRFLPVNILPDNGYRSSCG